MSPVRKHLVAILYVTILAFCCHALAVHLILRPLAALLLIRTPTARSRDRSWFDPSTKAEIAIGPEGASRPKAFQLDYDTLPFTRPEADLITSYLLATDSLLVFGPCPHSTALPFAPLVRRMLAISPDDRDCRYFINKRALLENMTSFSQSAQIVCAPLGSSRAIVARMALRTGQSYDSADNHLNNYSHSPETFPQHEEGPNLTEISRPSRVILGDEGSYHDYMTFVDYPLYIQPPALRFDKVLIDGPARVACALRILPRLHKNSIVFFHDFFLRPDHYHRILDVYEEVGRIVAHGSTVQISNKAESPMSNLYSFGMLVMRPKPGPHLDRGQDLPFASALMYQSNLDKWYREYVDPGDSQTRSSLDSAYKFISSTNSSGYAKEEHHRRMCRRSSLLRVVLDIIALLLLIPAYQLCCNFYGLITAGAKSIKGFTTKNIMGSPHLERDMRNCRSTGKCDYWPPH